MRLASPPGTAFSINSNISSLKNGSPVDALTPPSTDITSPLMKLEPSDARIQLNLASVYQKVGNQKLAGQAYFRYQELQQENADD